MAELLMLLIQLCIEGPAAYYENKMKEDAEKLEKINKFKFFSKQITKI